MIDHRRQSCHLCKTSHVPQYHQRTCHSYTSKAFSPRPYKTPQCTILFSSYAPLSYYSTPSLPLPPPRSSRPRNPSVSSPPPTMDPAVSPPPPPNSSTHPHSFALRPWSLAHACHVGPTYARVQKQVHRIAQMEIGSVKLNFENVDYQME